MGPCEPARFRVEVVESRPIAVEPVEIGHPAQYPGMCRTVQQVPVEAAVVVPLPALGHLVPHEEELLPRLPELIAVQQAQIGETLPIVAGHLLEERALAVHDLVVREREHEVLAEGIDAPERQLAVVVPPVQRISREVLQGVVHPAHVPLEPESDTTGIDGARDSGESCRLLGYHRHVGMVGIDPRVEVAQEFERLEVLAAPELVGDPFAGSAGVVQVEHGRHSIDP